MTYTNDAIACGSGVAMYDAMDREGHDARYLSFAPATGANGGHRDPENAWAWVVGCLGVTSACSSACAASFAACVDADGGADGPAKFASCETQLKAGSLGGCVVGCAPTLEMLRTSEQPVVSLSAGKFGTSTGLAVAASAPRPLCTTAIGEFGTNGITGGQCTPPSATVYPDFTVTPNACAPAPTKAPTDAASPTDAPLSAPTVQPTAAPTTVRGGAASSSGVGATEEERAETVVLIVLGASGGALLLVVLIGALLVVVLIFRKMRKPISITANGDEKQAGSQARGVEMRQTVDAEDVTIVR